MLIYYYMQSIKNLFEYVLGRLIIFQFLLILTYYYMHTTKKLSRNLKIFSSCKQKGSVRIIYRFTLQIGRFLGEALPPFNGNDNNCFLLHYLYIIRKESAAHGTLLLLTLPCRNTLLLQNRQTETQYQLWNVAFCAGFKTNALTSRTDSHCRTFHISV